MKFRGIIRTKPSIELTADQTVHHCASDETMLKGLLKGLRYISQIFDAVDRDDDNDDNEDEECEMQIGYPTDVKHVAHIGWNGPSTNSPNWMKGFASDQNSQHAAYGGESKDLICSPDVTNSSSGYQGLTYQEVTAEKPKKHRHHHASSRSGSSSIDHNTGNPNDSPKKTRHRSSSGGSSSECSKPTRKHHHHRHQPSGSSSDFSGQDIDIVGTTTKQSRRRKTKGSSASITGGRKPAKSPKSKGVAEGEEKGSDQFPTLKMVKEEGED